MLHIKSFVFSPIQENTYVVYNEHKHCTIIDPGCYYDAEREEILSFINKMELKPQMLLNTHCHLDHVFGNKFISEEFNLKLHIHVLEKPVLDFAPASGLMYNLPFDSYTGELVYVKEGDRIKMDTDELEVLLTPGHSPGSVSFYSAADGFVLSGDVLFQRSIGRTDLPGGDYDTLISSIREKLLVLPDEIFVYSGHGAVTTVGEEKRLNPFLQD